MASAKDNMPDFDQACKDFKTFAALAGKDDKVLTSKACGKMVKDCWEPTYKKFSVSQTCDASVFPACKKGPGVPIDKATVTKFMNKTAHELAKKKTKNTKILEGDPECLEICKDLCAKLKVGPNVKEVKTSTTGNVAGMTDAKNYTGAHKERFDESGKGKGLDGRSDKVDNTGYVGNYKGSGTYAGKK